MPCSRRHCKYHAANFFLCYDLLKTSFQISCCIFLFEVLEHSQSFFLPFQVLAFYLINDPLLNHVIHKGLIMKHSSFYYVSDLENKRPQWYWSFFWLRFRAKYIYIYMWILDKYSVCLPLFSATSFILVIMLSQNGTKHWLTEYITGTCTWISTANVIHAALAFLMADIWSWKKMDAHPWLYDSELKRRYKISIL